MINPELTDEEQRMRMERKLAGAFNPLTPARSPPAYEHQ
jgi:hypothetical protein